MSDHRVPSPAEEQSAVLDPQTAQALLDLATPVTAAAFRDLMTRLEATPRGTPEAAALMRVASQLLLLDTTKQHLQLVLASTTDTLVSVLAAVPDGPLRERVGNLIAYHANLPAMELREVIHELSQVAKAERLRAAEELFRVGQTAH